MKIFLETKRLILAEPSLGYVNEVLILDSDPEVMVYMGGPWSREQALKWLEKNIHHQEKHGFGIGFVFEKKTHRFIGRAGLLYLAYDDLQPDIEMGYRFHKEFWKKGYATEIAQALRGWGFEHLTVEKLVAVINPANERSQRVLEKIGMQYVGPGLYEGDQVDRYEIARMYSSGPPVAVI